MTRKAPYDATSGRLVKNRSTVIAGHANRQGPSKASRMVKRDADTGRFTDTFTIRDGGGVRTIHTTPTSRRVMDEAVEKYKNALKRLADK